MTKHIKDSNDDQRFQEEGGGISFHNEDKDAIRALIVVLDVKSSKSQENTGAGSRSIESSIQEIQGLAAAIELDIIHTEVVSLKAVIPATFMGTGKAADIKTIVHDNDVEVVIADAPLSPGQQRNLEKLWNCKVLDRTGLILEIFGRRAQTREGRLQVQLAHLAYQKSRLVRSWTHLERQRGGGGTVGGPGETQKESDRRDLQTGIQKLEKQLEKVKKTRGLHRKSRQKVPYPIVALVGYTNAGKSTLFNKVTSGDVMAEDMLFATLDPTMRSLTLPHGRKVILSDTVGFISNLPTQLVASFRATLEEVLSADLIIHVRDIAHADSDIQRDDVLTVLADLGVPQGRFNEMLEAWNKADLLDQESLVEKQNIAERSQKTVVLSSLTGEGIDDLLAHIEHGLAKNDNLVYLELDTTRGADIAWLYQNGEVLQRIDAEDGKTVQFEVRFAYSKLNVASQKFDTALIDSDEFDSNTSNSEGGEGEVAA